MAGFTAQEIADRVGGELIGPGDLPVRGASPLDAAGADQITFVRDQRKIEAWRQSESRVALVPEKVQIDAADLGNRAVIKVPSPDAAMAQVLGLFAPPKVVVEPGIHPTAVIAESATIGSGVAVGPYCVIGRDVTIGDGTALHGRVSIMDRCTVGSACELFPGVVLREDSQVGEQTMIHANAVIGSDGFGYTPSADGRQIIKIPHLCGVTIGAYVEIGAGTCIDRGKFSPTTIGDGTKIDNMCQIGHNARIGRGCLIAGQAGLAGSVTIGDGVQLGGNVGVRDNVSIGDGAQIAAYAAVMEDVPAGAAYGGYPAQEIRQALREVAAVRKLPDLIKQLRTDRDKS